MDVWRKNISKKGQEIDDAKETGFMILIAFQTSPSHP